MSLDGVAKKIDLIMRKPVVEEKDIDEVITAAERSTKGRTDGVSNTEGRAILDFYMATANVGGKAHAPRLEPLAENKLNHFFVAHQIPGGANRAPMKDRINDVIAKRESLGEPVAKPRRGNLQPLRLNGAGETPKDALVDIVKKLFFVRLEDKYYGPFNLDAA